MSNKIKDKDKTRNNKNEEPQTPSLQLKFCDLPREATISFTVVGMSRNEDNNVKADNKVAETPLADGRFINWS